MTLIPLDLSADEAVNEAIEQRPVAVCIGAISPTRGAEVRNFCRRLRNAVPETKVIVLRPLALEVDIERSSTRMQEAGADIVVTNAKDAVEAIERLLAEAPATRAALKTWSAVGRASARLRFVRLKPDPQGPASRPPSAARRSSAS